jgi:hypothetical protein
MKVYLTSFALCRALHDDGDVVSYVDPTAYYFLANGVKVGDRIQVAKLLVANVCADEPGDVPMALSYVTPEGIDTGPFATWTAEVPDDATRSARLEIPLNDFHMSLSKAGIYRLRLFAFGELLHEFGVPVVEL